MSRQPLPAGATPTTPTTAITVHGGIGSVRVQFAPMGELVRTFEGLESEAQYSAADLWSLGLDPGPVTSTLDPDGAARVRAALHEALDGPQGLRAATGATGALTDAVLQACLRYLGADSDLSGGLAEFGRGLRSATDFVAGAAEFAGAFAVDTGPLGVLYRSLGGGLLLQDWWQDHPGVEQALAQSLLTMLALPLGYERSSAVLAMFYKDGVPVLTRTGEDTSPAATAPTTGTAALIGNLARTNDAEPGTVKVQLVDEPDGTRTAKVYLPGVKEWNIGCLPGLNWVMSCSQKQVGSIGSTLRAGAGLSTTYSRGVLQALRELDVTAEDRVFLIGHSEGGDIAADIATEVARTGEFTVPAIITAGSPNSRLLGAVPASTQVLALENRQDIVPRVDLRENPELPNVVTVTADVDRGTDADNHDIRTSYGPIADAVDASQDPSLVGLRQAVPELFEGLGGREYGFVIRPAA